MSYFGWVEHYFGWIGVSGGVWSIILGGWGKVGVGGALFWMNRGRWEYTLGGWGLVGMSGSGWG